MAEGKRYLIVDTNKDRANRLMTMIRQIDKDAGFLFYTSVLTYQAQVKATENLSHVCGAIIRFDGNLKETSYLIDHIYQTNPKVFVLVSADTLNIEVLKNLIQFRVSQVLTPPLYLETLREKMKFAEEFQKKILAENSSMPSYRPFRCWHEINSEGNNVAYIVGWLADKCELPKISPNKKTSALYVDLDLMDGISSIGVRSWMLWHKEMSASGFNKVIFRNVRHFMINQAASISGFFPQHSSVESFYLRYYFDGLDKELEMLYQKGQDFNDAEMVIPLMVKANENIENSLFVLEDQVEKLASFYSGKVQTVDKTISGAGRKLQLMGT